MNCFFRRDANVLPPPGMVIAEFSNATDAYHFAQSKGPRYTVTAGRDNFPFVVRVRHPEPSSALPPAGGTAPSPACHGEGRRFQLIPLTPRGAEQEDHINALLASIRLPHGAGDL